MYFIIYPDADSLPQREAGWQKDSQDEKSFNFFQS